MRNGFAHITCTVLVVKKVLVEHKEVSLKIYRKRVQKLRNWKTKFNHGSTQLAMLFEIYANFESVLRGAMGW